jgi:hypothetical protein
VPSADKFRFDGEEESEADMKQDGCTGLTRLNRISQYLVHRGDLLVRRRMENNDGGPQKAESATYSTEMAELLV